MKVNNRRDIIEKIELDKLINKKQREDKRKKNLTVIERTIKEGKSLKQAQGKLALGKKEVISLMNEHGEVVNDKTEILKIVENYYGKLYSSKKNIPHINIQIDNNTVPEIGLDEIKHALKDMKRGKTPAEDGILTDYLKDGGLELHQRLAFLFNKCIQIKQVPEEWCKANVILLHKKGDQRDLGNYRPISLLSNIYKLFSKIILNRIVNQLDEKQPREQAGFRSGYSTMDHLHTINQLIEKTLEYNRKLCIAFIDYEKAFDSVEHIAVFNSLRTQGISENLIELLEYIYVKGTATIKMHTETNKIKIKRGVRQGDTISPKLFSACLEEVFNKLDWDNKGIRIDGEYLNHLRFADDIVLIAESVEELQEMLNDLNRESLRVGLKMNKSKTKVMFNDNMQSEEIKIGTETLEEVNEYIYLGQIIKLTYDKDSEVKRRINIGWKAYNKYRYIMRSDMPLSLKRKIFNHCIIPAMTYGSETWKLTKGSENKLIRAQRAMERSMMKLTLRNKKRASWIRQNTKVDDIIESIKIQKWRWAGHVARLQDNRWTKRLTEWMPRGKRLRKRPNARWRDEIVRFTGNLWQRQASCRSTWKRLGEAFVQQWTTDS